MRKPILFFWLWLVYSLQMIAWHGILAASQVGSASAELPQTTEGYDGRTTVNPIYQYEDDGGGDKFSDVDYEGVTNQPESISSLNSNSNSNSPSSPTTSPSHRRTSFAIGGRNINSDPPTNSNSNSNVNRNPNRNFGNRIRGINSSPYIANSVNSFTSSPSPPFYTSSTNYNDGTVTPPLFRPRPTSSVISYNPNNYNRMVKRRKNSSSNSTTLTNLSDDNNNNNNSSNYNNFTSSNNYTIPKISSSYINTNSNSNNGSVSLSRTRGGSSSQKEVFVPLSQPTSQTQNGIGNGNGNGNSSSTSNNNNNNNGLHKVIIRKRPKPITLNDPVNNNNNNNNSPVPTNPPTTFESYTENEFELQNQNNNNNNKNRGDSSSSSSSFSFSSSTSPTLRPRRIKGPNANSILYKSSRPDYTSSSSSDSSEFGSRFNLQPSSSPSPIQVEATPSPPPPSSSPSNLHAEPVSNVPVSSLSFEYNPSVSEKDGIYRFHYSDPSVTYSSKRVHSENFGVSRVTYGHMDDGAENEEDVDTGHDETTTFSPSSEGSTNPISSSNGYQINIDGSEEEFTSSLPPVYRQYFTNEEGQYQNQQSAGTTNNHLHGRDVPAVNGDNKKQAQEHGSITVTVTHTVTANPSPSVPLSIQSTKSIQSHQHPIVETTKLAVAAANISESQHSNSSGDVVNTIHQNSNPNQPTFSSEGDAPSLPISKEANSHPNTIPIVGQQDHFNNNNNSNNNNNNNANLNLHLDHTPSHASSHEENLLRPTPALPPILSPSSASNSNSNSNHHQSISNSGSNNSSIPAGNVAESNTNAVKAEDEDHQHAGGHNTNNNNTNHHNSSENVLKSQVTVSPTVSSKVLTSVYFTKEENPYYTTSSYSYGSTTEYSYHGPHDPDHNHNHDEEHEHDGHTHSPDHSDHSIEADNSQKQQELRPTTSSFWDSLGQKSADLKPTSNQTATSTTNTYRKTTAGPSGRNKTVPIHHDQELGFSTPQIDTELPPNGISISGKDVDRSSSSSSGRQRPTTPMPGDSEIQAPEVENEIDDEENNTNSSDGSKSDSDDEEDEDSDGRVDVKTKTGTGSKNKGTSYNENEAELPAVPVFIQVLLDMPATVFCSKVSVFKEMVAKVYAAKKLQVTKDQVIVFNEPNCSNLTSRRNPSNYTSNTSDPADDGINVKFATTTASVLRTLSSTARTIAQRSRNNNSRNHHHHSHNTSSFPLTTSQPRFRRNDHHHYYNHSNSNSSGGNDRLENDINSNNNASSSTYNFSSLVGVGDSDSDYSEPAGAFPTEGTTLYPVFFYLTDKNGSYNQYLTESFIEFWNNTKGSSQNTMFFNKIKRVEMMSPTSGITGHAPTNENTGVIAAITIASIAAVCLFLLGVLLLVMRHRQAQSKFAKRCTPVSLDDYSLDNISVFGSFRRKQRNRASKRSYTNAAFDDPNAPSRPCTAAELAAVVSERSKLEEEFSDLPTSNPTLDDIPQGAETKNRYANVIPIPDTRVLLTFQEDVPNSDYINANYVRGPMGVSKGYIITQGPLEDTIVDFWRMIWEQQVRVIMMLTDFSEAGIPKSAPYYPRSETVDSSQLHGDFQITLEKREISEHCITSYLVIKDMERNLRRDVIHLWYHSYPEQGVPPNPKMTADFLAKSRKFTKEPTPVVVHCSPGTGRSGLLVACDIGIREFESQQRVNIPRTVMKVRQDRAGAVQTKEQYLHIYDVINYYTSRLGSQLDSI